MAITVLKLTTNESAASDSSVLLGSESHVTANKLIDVLAAMAGGAKAASLSVAVAGVTAATDTVTFSAAATANDTVIVNGITFTAISGVPAAHQFDIGLDESDSAESLAASINADPLTLVVASAALGVVTLTAVQAGVMGNAITVAEGVDFGGVISVATPRLAGGVDATPTVYSFGR